MVRDYFWDKISFDKNIKEKELLMDKLYKYTKTSNDLMDLHNKERTKYYINKGFTSLTKHTYGMGKDP